MTAETRVRIGELAQRVGVSEHVLRAWERRFGVFSPTRSAGGYRLYSAADEAMARRMIELRDRGLPLATAAQQVLDGSLTGIRDVDPAQIMRAFAAAVDAMDPLAARQSLDSAIDGLGLAAAVRHVLVPALHEIGDRWEADQITVAHEHFASHTVRRLLIEQYTDNTATAAPTAVLACPPGEKHDIGLLALGVLMSREGWHIRFLGAETPMGALLAITQALRPDLVVLSASRRAVLSSAAPLLRPLAAAHRVAIGGRGAVDGLAESLGAHQLPSDLLDAAKAARGLIRARGGDRR